MAKIKEALYSRAENDCGLTIFMQFSERPRAKGLFQFELESKYKSIKGQDPVAG